VSEGSDEDEGTESSEDEGVSEPPRLTKRPRGHASGSKGKIRVWASDRHLHVVI
jgi:hypothetical protein